MCQVVGVGGAGGTAGSGGGRPTCVPDSGGTGGSGGMAGSGGAGGTAGIGGMAGIGGAGGTAGIGGMAGIGGADGTAGIGGMAGSGGGPGSCAEIDVPGEPNLTGPLSVSPPVATFDDFVTVTVGVDGDTQEVTVILRNSNSGIVGGTGFATTSGNETLPVDVLVGTVADPGQHVVDLELRADASNRVDYVLYESGGGDKYVRITVENSIPGLETETTCLQLICDIEF